MAFISIIPSVKKYIDNGIKIKFNKLSLDKELSKFHRELLCEYINDNSEYKIKFNQDSTILNGAYSIEVFEDSISCVYSNEEGLHNCICTLRQLLMNINKLTTCSIYDEPLFKVRSVMIDVSRNKIPKLETLKYIAYNLSLLKINDLQLYLEGKTLYYEFLNKYYDDKNDYLLPEDVVALREYCEEIGITLTPNTNCFGHMAYWLNQEELKHLALNPEGFEMYPHGPMNYAQTIDPDNEEAVDFILKQIDEVLKCYPNCTRMTIGGDEPFELLKLPNAKEVYVKHMSKIIEYVKSRGITPCMWGDVVKEYPDTLEYLKDAILLEWGYEEGQINEKNCSMYKEYNVPYMVCPGTSGWLSFTGRMKNMLGNFNDAAKNGSTFGALGMVITDWNDGGAMSQLPTNLLSYAYGACFAWGDKVESQEQLHKYLDEEVFKLEISDSIFNLGNYYLCQEKFKWCLTSLYISYFSCQTDGINIDIKNYSDCNTLLSNKDVLNHLEIEKTEQYLNEWESNFKYDENNQFSKEMYFIYRIIKHSLKLNLVYLKLANIVHCKSDIEYLLEDVNYLINKYDEIWHFRNKNSDYKFSVKRLEMLEFKYKNLLNLLEL